MELDKHDQHDLDRATTEGMPEAAPSPNEKDPFTGILPQMEGSISLVSSEARRRLQARDDSSDWTKPGWYPK